MKKVLLIINIFILFQSVLLSQTLDDFFSNIKRIDVYYLSWNYYPNKKISENDVRNYYGRNSFFQINNKDTISEFIKALNIFYFDEVEYGDYDIYMVIDLFSSDNNKKTITLIKSKAVYFNKRLFINYYLAQVIKKYIPETNAPY